MNAREARECRTKSSTALAGGRRAGGLLHCEWDRESAQVNPGHFLMLRCLTMDQVPLRNMPFAVRRTMYRSRGALFTECVVTL